MTTQQLKDYRAAHGLSRAKLAARLGVSPRTVEGWELGRRAIPRMVEILLRSLTAARRPSR